MTFFNFFCSLFLFLAIAASTNAQQTARPRQWKFDFGAAAMAGYTTVKPTDLYNDSSGYGFERVGIIASVIRKSASPLTDGFISSTKPFYFSVNVPEGNYNVKVIAGDKQG